MSVVTKVKRGRNRSHYKHVCQVCLIDERNLTCAIFFPANTCCYTEDGEWKHQGLKNESLEVKYFWYRHFLMFKLRVGAR